MLIALMLATGPLQPPTRVAALDGGACLPVVGPLTDTQLRASPVSVTCSNCSGGGGGTSSLVYVVDAGPPLNVNPHAVSVSNFPATQPVSLASVPTHGVTGTFWQSTQPVSISSMPSTPVTGTFWQATQPVSIASMPSTPVTGTFWQATQPVSLASTTITGSVAVTGPLTDAQLRASAVPVSLASTTVTGTVAVSMAGSNPCQSPSATLAAVAGATSGTAAVQLVALSGSTKIYLCSVNVTGISGATPTFSLKYGTGTACTTGGVTILGPWTTAANTVYTFNQPFVTPAGQALCYLDTGTTPVQNYAISYVQQ